MNRERSYPPPDCRFCFALVRYQTDQGFYDLAVATPLSSVSFAKPSCLLPHAIDEGGA